MAEIYKGFVKWFNDAKGFGFIEHESGKDVFVHYSVIESDGFKTLKDGEEVAYELKEGEKGLHAARVARTNAPERSSAEQTEAERDGYIAPRLETGSVPTEIRTASQMIEVDEIGTSSGHDDSADESESDADDASSEHIRTV